MSCTTKNMIKPRSESLKCVKIIIVNGHSTMLWTEQWLNCKSLVDILGQDIYYISEHKHAIISQLIQQGQWNTLTLAEARERSALINAIQIQPEGTGDYWEWCGQQDFSLSKTWENVQRSK